MSSLPPKLTPDQLVKKMQEKNIRSEFKDANEIKEYLSIHNNYFRTASYRKNYEKHTEGENEGKYIDLDFSYLTELATIDMYLRFLLLKMCLDIEHSLKVLLVTDIAVNDEEDGYSIVKNFVDKYPKILTDIYYKSNSTYVGDLIKKHFAFEDSIDEEGKATFNLTKNDCPVWAFMEIITFGDFIKFYSAYYELYPIGENYTGTLNSVRSLRNACAHNNCIIHNLRKGYSKPSTKISQFISNIPNITKSERKSVLSVRAVFEITSLIYLYDKIVFEPVKQYRFKELSDLINGRMIKHSEYFEKQDIIKSSYNFLKKVVDFLMETTYNTDDNKKL